jgi:hypothetical protein
VDGVRGVVDIPGRWRPWPAKSSPDLAFRAPADAELGGGSALYWQKEGKGSFSSPETLREALEAVYDRVKAGAFLARDCLVKTDADRGTTYEVKLRTWEGPDSFTLKTVYTTPPDAAFSLRDAPEGSPSLDNLGRLLEGLPANEVRKGRVNLSVTDFYLSSLLATEANDRLRSPMVSRALWIPDARSLSPFGAAAVVKGLLRDEHGLFLGAVAHEAWARGDGVSHRFDVTLYPSVSRDGLQQKQLSVGYTLPSQVRLYEGF